MYKSTARIASAAPISRALPKAHVFRRFVSTAPPHRTSRTWRNSALRWGLAGALVYYYNTATAFAEEPLCECNLAEYTSKFGADRQKTLSMRHPKHHRKRRLSILSLRYQSSGEHGVSHNLRISHLKRSPQQWQWCQMAKWRLRAHQEH